MSYGKTRYIHKETEKVFVAWVTARSPYMQSLQNKPIWLSTLEREFYRIKERLPEEVINELVAIVDARETAKVMHMANNTHDEGHENCLRMYKRFLRRADQQTTAAIPSSSPPPSPTSDEDFPAIGTTKLLSPSPSPSSLSSPASGNQVPAIDSPKPLPSTPRDSTKRLFSTISSDPPTTPSVMRTGSVKRQRLVLKLRSTTSASQNVAAY